MNLLLILAPLVRYPLALPEQAPRQAHSPSGYTDMYSYCSNFAVISLPFIGTRPGRRCPHFVLKWRYAEVFVITVIGGDQKTRAWGPGLGRGRKDALR